MPGGWDPPKLTVDSASESVFTDATSYTPSTGKIITPGDDYECIVGVDANGNLEILAIEFGTASEDNLPVLRMTTAQFDAVVDALGEQKPGVVTLTQDSLITG